MIEVLTSNTPNGKKITIMLEEIGYKYKISDLQAALGCAQMTRINTLVNKKRFILNFLNYMIFVERKKILRTKMLILRSKKKSLKNLK